MVQAFTATQTIDRPVQQVWKELTDWDRASGWMPGVDSVRAGGDTVPGTTLLFRARGKQRASTITAVIPDRSVTLTSTQGGVSADYTYSVEPAGDGTRVTLVVDCVTRGLWTLARPALRGFMRRADGGQLDALKRQIEQG